MFPTVRIITVAAALAAAGLGLAACGSADAAAPSASASTASALTPSRAWLVTHVDDMSSISTDSRAISSAITRGDLASARSLSRDVADTYDVLAEGVPTSDSFGRQAQAVFEDCADAYDAGADALGRPSAGGSVQPNAAGLAAAAEQLGDCASDTRELTDDL
jgi:hypothetical protein